jgi:two-component system chemotaxis response regulator CheY
MARRWQRSAAMPTALIVDDSPVMRAHLRSILQQAGCEVVGEGARGDELLPLYERHRPDLVTLDIVMPGKDGVAAATELLAKYPHAVVVMCTSMTSRDKILACQKAGVAHYLIKPFQPERAIQTLRHVINRAQLRSAS